MEVNSTFLWVMVLIAARFLGAMMICPLFINERIPQLVKVLLSACFAMVIAPHYIYSNIATWSLWFKLFLLCKELVVGFILGYLFSLPIWMVENIGNLIDMQRGEQFGAVVNQLTKNPASSIGKFMINGFMVYLVSANGILFFIKLIYNSFGLIQCDSLLINTLATKEFIIKMFSQYFYWLMILALPVVFLMFILEFTMGILSTFVQSLNVTILSMPLKSLLCLFILIFYIGVIYHVAISKSMENIYQGILTL